MASFSRYLLIFLLLISIIVLISHTAKCDDDGDDHDHDHDHDDDKDHGRKHRDKEDNLLQGINSHRASLKLGALAENDVAECLADEMADQFKHQPCSTGPGTIPAGIRPELSNYPSLLAKCGSNLTIARDGVVLPACVPSLAPDLVLSSYTTSPQYSKYLNDGKFLGIGIDIEDDNWIVVVLITSTPVRSPRGGGLRDEEDDEEDILLQGINSFRGSLNLSALTENDKAECLADEIADQFNDQPCRAATSSYPAPGSQPQILSYRRFLAKCGVNAATAKDGIVLPVCVPNLVPSVVLSNYTASPQYARYLRDTKFTGIGIGTEDDWMVIVLTTNTPGGSFIASQNVGYATNASAKLDPVYHFMVLLIVSFSVMLL